MNEELIEEIRKQALLDKVPIMEDEGIAYVKNYLLENNIQSMLEVGTAVGYSSIVFASYCPNLQIVTLEKDEQRHEIAKKNIEKAGLNKRITPILTDAREYEETAKFACLFLDGPKAHNQELLERYLNNLEDDGVIIIDDVWFHGYIDNPDLITTRRLKTLVRKLGKFRDDMLANPAYESTYLEIGDGILICKRRK